MPDADSTLGHDDTVGAPDSLTSGAGLSGPRDGDTIGRYVLVQRLGAGGMGVVFAAYDPELDRKIAVKLLHPSDALGSQSAGAQARLLREAQLTAKLSHPNVVAVFDVGQHEGQVFLAMEFIAGSTLSQWQSAPDRSWREILSAYIRAGRGLSAAHRAGLVHHDFKPDNVMIDDDGRVRVMDFGLARATAKPLRGTSDTVADAAIDGPNGVLDDPTFAGIAGTPKFMSPEQWKQTEVDERSDQFSFCVALFGAVHGDSPFAGNSWAELSTNVLDGNIAAAPANSTVPRWLDQALRRGLSTDPADRFESMAALIEVLERGQARRRRRLWAVGGLSAAAVAVVGMLAGQVAERQRAAACRADGQTITQTWNEARSHELHDRFAATRLSYAGASAQTVVDQLDGFTRRWADDRTAACMAAADLRWREKHADAAAWCLDEQRVQFEVLISELLEANGESLEGSASTASRMGGMSSCVDPQVLEHVEPPAAEARGEALALRRADAQVAALARSGRLSDAMLRAIDNERASLTLGWKPLVAATALRRGELLSAEEKLPEAEAAFERAFFEARAARSDRLVAEAAAHLIDVVGADQQRFEDGRRWARHAQLELDELDDAEPLVRADMYQSLAELERQAGDYDRATSLLRQALELRIPRLSQTHPEAASTVSDLGLVAWDAGDFEQALKLHQRALQLYRDNLGPDHPYVGDALANLALVHEAQGDYARAEELNRQVLRIYEAARGPEHTTVARTLNNLAVIATALERNEESRQLQRRAHAIWAAVYGDEHPLVAQSLVNLAVSEASLGNQTEAETLYTRALEIRRDALGPNHSLVAQTLNNLGVIRLEARDYASAADLYAQALAIYESTVAPGHPHLLASLDNLAEATLRAGSADEAQRLYERSLRMREATAPDHPDMAYTLVGLSEVALAQGAPTRAVNRASKAVQIRQKSHPGGLLLADARFVLAQALWAEERRTQALEEAKRAHASYASQEHAADQAQRVDEWIRSRH